MYKTLQNASSSACVLDALQKRFLKNKSFFEKNIPSYAKLLDLDLKTYSIDISKSGINLINLQTNEYVYEILKGKSSLLEYNAKLANDPSHNNLWEKIGIDSLIKDELDIVPITGKITHKIEQIAKENPLYNKNQVHFNALKQMPTTVIIGLLSGLFLDILLEKTSHIHSIFIYEPNVELFVLSAYFLDYQNLYAKTNDDSCYIVIGGKLDTKIAKDFFASRLITNSYFRMQHTSYYSDLTKDAQNLIEEVARSNTRGWGTYEDEIIGVKNKLFWLDPKMPKYPYLAKPYKTNAPCLVVANAPSLNEQISFLQKNQDKFFIISAGSVLAVLKQNAIEPDFHVEIERMPHVQKWLKDAKLDNTSLVAGDLCHPSTLEFAKETLCFVRGSSAADEMFAPSFKLDYANPLVGNAALNLALCFFDEIYIIGMDLGFKNADKIHAAGSLYDKMKDNSQEALQTRGNLSPNIYTNSLFSLARSSLEILLSKHKTTVYNLSDGVFIKGTKPLKAIDLGLKKPINKQELKAQIKQNAFKQKDFFKAFDDYQNELKIYKNSLEKMLDLRVSNKLDLYKFIDTMYFFSVAWRTEHSISGTLLSGTLWHILNTIFVSLLRINSNDIEKEFAQITKLIQKELKNFVL